MKNSYCRACVITLLVALSMTAHAEKADRDKPINLEGDRLSIDDLNKVQILEGNAVLDPGHDGTSHQSPGGYAGC